MDTFGFGTEGERLNEAETPEPNTEGDILDSYILPARSEQQPSTQLTHALDPPNAVEPTDAPVPGQLPAGANVLHLYATAAPLLALGRETISSLLKTAPGPGRMPLSKAFQGYSGKLGVLMVPYAVRQPLDTMLFNNKATTDITDVTDLVIPFAAMSLLPKLGPLKTTAASILAHVVARAGDDYK